MAEPIKQKQEEEVVQDPHEPNIKGTLGMIPLVGPEFIGIGLGLLGSAAIGTVPILLYLVLGELIDSFATPPGSSGSAVVVMAAGYKAQAILQSKINRLSFWMTMIAIASGVAAFLSNFFLNLAHDRISSRLKSAYFHKLLDQEIGFFDMKRTGELISNLTESLDVISDALSVKMGKVVEGIVQLIFGLIMALIAGWKMALVMLSAAPLLIGVLGFTGFITQVFTKRISHYTGISANIANEVISSMRTVRSMDGEEKEKTKFDHALSSANIVYGVKAFVLGTSLGIAFFSIWAVIALAFWFGGKIAIRGEMTIGDMLQVFGFVMMGIIGFSQSLQVLPDMSKANTGMITLLKVIKRKPTMKPSGGVIPNKIEGHLEFKDVSFSYPTRPNAKVLKNFSLTIRPGQSVALVGASGSGKSTIVGLIEKFYEQESGEIVLDGVNLRDIDPRWLHQHVGIVTQEPTLFAATIRENILYAVSHKEVTDEEIIEAAKAANAHDFISALPDGYNTLLGERGISLSGGQKQRVAIARAMIQNPSLLLLDEATSALDTQSESVVQDALNNLMKGRTSIVIAHRLSTVVDSDIICVMNKGELKEQGTHHELLQIKNGYYFKLAQKQMKFGQHQEDSGDPETTLTNSISEMDLTVGIDTNEPSQQQQQTETEQNQIDVEQLNE